MNNKIESSTSASLLQKVRRQLVFILFLCLTSSYIFNIYLSSYFQVNLTESLIFNVDDGWCDPQNQGIGLHCFGDFYAFMQFNFENPWKDTITPYPPVSLIFFKALKSLYVLTQSSNLVLVLYLIALVFALVFPILHLYYSKRVSSKQVCLIMVLVLFSLAPTLMVIDRGNNIGFAVPFIYLAYIFLIQGKDFSFLMMIVVISLWKPQLSILALLFIFSGKYKWFLRWLVMTFFGYIVSFCFFGIDNLFSNVTNFIKNLIGYQGYVSVPGYFPSNWSFVNFISTVRELPRLISSLPAIDFDQVSKLPANSISIISGLFLIGSLFTIFLRRSIFSDLELLVLLSMISFLTPSVTFSYYLSVMLPLVIVITYGFIAQSTGSPNSLFKEQEKINIFLTTLFTIKRLRYLLIGVVSTCFVSWPFIWQFLGVEQSNPISNIGIMWTFGLIFINTFFLALLFRRK